MNDLAGAIHRTAVKKGFYADEVVYNSVGFRQPNPAFAGERLMLIVSECAEVMEAIRDNEPAHEAEEVADVLIRVLDYAAWRGFDIDQEVRAKMAKNERRPKLHGRAR